MTNMKNGSIRLPVTIGGRQAVVANFLKDNEPLIYWFVITEKKGEGWGPWHEFDIRQTHRGFELPPFDTPQFYKTTLFNLQTFINYKINSFEELGISV
jgi:hypothetical protein